MTDDRIIPTSEDRKPETAVSRKEKLKKERIPMHEQKTLCYNEMEPGWHYRMINDTPGRIQKLLKAGWELVKGSVESTYSGKQGQKEKSDQGSYIKRIVDPNSLYTEGVLMRIPLDIWQEDLKAKEARLEALEENCLGDTGELRKARILGPRANIKLNK